MEIPLVKIQIKNSLIILPRINRQLSPSYPMMEKNSRIIFLSHTLPISLTARLGCAVLCISMGHYNGDWI